MSVDDHRRLQLDVHISEYQAVTTRATYYVAISSAVWPVIGVYLTVVAMSWSQIVQHKYGLSTILWLSGAVVQACLMTWAGTLSEQYNMVLYVEQHLRRLVQEIVLTPRFWLYEPFNAARRAKSGAYLWWEMAVPYAMLAVLLMAACHRVVHFKDGTYLLDAVGLAINSTLLTLLFRLCRSVVKTRRAWETSEHDVEAFLSKSQAPKKGQQVPS